MTPKEKAEELVWTFGKCVNDLNTTYEQAKQCALIAVDFALEFVDGDSLDEAFDKTLYLIEIKNEIEKL